MKTAWDKYLDLQLANPSIGDAYQAETKALAKTRKSTEPMPPPSRTQPSSSGQLRVKAPSAR